jgi:hypothetical protein
MTELEEVVEGKEETVEDDNPHKARNQRKHRFHKAFKKAKSKRGRRFAKRALTR